MNSCCRCVIAASVGLLCRPVFAVEATASESSVATLAALIVPLFAVVVALVALWWILRRHGGRMGASGPARIVQVLGVGPRERVLVIDCDSRRLLLGVTQSTISLLTELDAENAATIRSSASPLS
jgi:flagellar biosynthetic protein FliO